MRAFKAIPFALAATLLFLVAAGCGGASSGDQAANLSAADAPAADQTSATPSSDLPYPRTPPAANKRLVSSATDVLGTSSQRFQEDVQSLRAEMQFNIEAGGFSASGDADFVYQAPDKLHLTMQMSGGDGADTPLDLSDFGTMEMLLLGSDVYLNTPFTGWVSMSLEDLGVNGSELRDLLSRHSPIDYDSLIQHLGGQVQDLGEESVEGGTYRHYSVSLNLADLLSAFAAAFPGSSALGGNNSWAGNVSGPLTLDLWVDPESYLPHKLTAGGRFQVASQAMAFDMTARFFDYNEPVSIPEPPADARPFETLFQGDTSPFQQLAPPAGG